MEKRREKSPPLPGGGEAAARNWRQGHGEKKFRASRLPLPAADDR
jgi:hypothetical protein